MTSEALPVVRGPVALAKTLGAIDLLSGGRLDAGLGPGSSERDYAVVGMPFAERWPRFEEATTAVRAPWPSDGEPFVGRLYNTTGISLTPPPAQPGGPSIWVGSWGSGAGLRRVARLSDGGLASGYDTTAPNPHCVLVPPP
jgi:alkanesulfonate monooxygenase SsuD/methylene tetrahydromethanopterin reductase-like flavin-dependent oxidoreductase (luciferase family)